MRNLTEQLTQYAAYHRDRRNILTHFVGIPMIVLAVAVLLARPVFAQWGAVAVSPATVVTALAVLYYLKLDLRLGVFMAALMALSLWFAQAVGAQSTAMWLTVGIGLFVVGWVIQFVGHYYEGRKPAFVDDLVGLIIGPLFVVAEMGFLLGLRQQLQHDIESQVGPVREGPPAHAA